MVEITPILTHKPPVVVVFDVETRRLASDVGGWTALKGGAGGISCVVVWDSSTGRAHLYDEHTLEDCAKHLEIADVVLSFNGIEFDIPVIEGILGRGLSIGHHIDLLQLIWDAIGPIKKRGNSLNAVALRTLAQGKSGDGAHAPELVEDGRWAELFDYCMQDVDLTRRLFKFAKENGGVIGTNGELLPLQLPEYFSEVTL